jgi:hypothetical protein
VPMCSCCWSAVVMRAVLSLTSFILRFNDAAV